MQQGKAAHLQLHQTIGGTTSQFGVGNLSYGMSKSAIGHLEE